MRAWTHFVHCVILPSDCIYLSMIKTAHSVSNLRSNLELSPCVIKRTQSSHFVQILDESMCVVREDLTEWLQHYLFSTANACPIEAHYLLCRLASGLWLSRLAYKTTLFDFGIRLSDCIKIKINT
ncbi:unnamed protein product [Schistosoma mattheei]|uniref:Uncharacterized protein n=1 Tax=Schistosoma mattheei TaxID=31246 RepID=A0AA85AW38_9TREM|nr:unnamed protein product [Schistosoma mattheei]